MKTSQWTSKPLQQKSNLTSSGTSPTFSPCEFGGHRDPGVFLGSWETQTEKLVVPTPKKLTCHLKSDHFKVNFIFQPSIFNKCGTVVFMGGNDSETRLSFFFPISFSCGFQVCIPSLIAPYLASSSRVGNTNVLLLLMKKGPQLYGSTDCHGLPWIPGHVGRIPPQNKHHYWLRFTREKNTLPSSERLYTYPTFGKGKSSQEYVANG